MPPKKGTKKQAKKPEETKIEQVTNITENAPTVESEKISDQKPILASPTIKTSNTIASKSSAITTIDKNIILNPKIGSAHKINEHKDDKLSNENEQKQSNILKTKLESVVSLKQSNIFKNEAQLKMLELRKLRFAARTTNQINTLTAEEVNLKFPQFNKFIQISEVEQKKLQERAKRFGIKTTEDEVSKLKKRAERFHLPLKVLFTMPMID